MSRWRTTVVLCVLSLLLVTGPAGAEDGKQLTYNGVYTAWFQSQKNFLFGKADYNDNYTVQMFRLNLNFVANDQVSAHTRFDMAQGWWGVDNADRTANRPGGGSGGSHLFDFKDTNFLFHVDQAYAKVKLPDQHLMFRVGRMNHSLGNKLVLDNNLDGISVTLKDKLTVSFAKVSEGVDGLTDNETLDEAEVVVADGDDANLFTLVFNNKTEKLEYSAFALMYFDNGYADGSSYLPNDLNYFRSRFAPNVTELTTVGLSAEFADKDKGLTISGEANLLFGKDEIEQTAINSRQINDLNTGDLSGFNLYIKLGKDVGEKFALGGVFGMGSGDDDLTDGDGNVNKLRTSGFFYLTEVWEDSIMPDEEGITPQGLGAPNVRGYRELENTTAFQINATAKPHPKWTVFGSFTILKATESIPSWSVDSSDPDNPVTVIDYEDSSSDIGSEIDYRVVFAIAPSVTVGVRGGFFMPGDGAGYLINGNTDFDDMAYETKGFVTAKF